ncbi:hypothetical protein CRG98_034352 [Punica granatum]|uniref:E3 ubiquitin-protein ligase RNF123/RKP TPR repeat domain-containing protein n=1 Tax=Punica granatum TaxID=22663 RepID=A0A2I0IMP4_PUNGR|nr:hypothetical protein CRG98_034352 [Punica granatum]
MLLAPLAGIILNLLDACGKGQLRSQNDVVNVFASTDCFNSVHCGFQYLLEYNWAESVRADAYLGKLLDGFLSLLTAESKESAKECWRWSESKGTAQHGKKAVFFSSILCRSSLCW